MYTSKTFFKKTLGWYWYQKAYILAKNIFKRHPFTKPPGRIELPTPGLQDQCSNHWAMEAATEIWPQYLSLTFILRTDEPRKHLRWKIDLHKRFYGVMVSTLDFESSDPSSNLGRTFPFFLLKILYIITRWLRGATVARLTPDQKAACSNHVGVKHTFIIAK